MFRRELFKIFNKSEIENFEFIKSSKYVAPLRIAGIRMWVENRETVIIFYELMSKTIDFI